MDCKRNRILAVVNYLESLGIEINIGKNKAQGNKGVFKAIGKKFRIDISKTLTEDEILSVLAHEFAHYVHYCNDKSLKSLNFILGQDLEFYEEDFLLLTVESIPKNNIKPLFAKKESIRLELASLKEKIRIFYPQYKLTEPLFVLEKEIKKTKYKYLLSYDKVKVLNGFTFEFLSIDSLNTYLLDESIKIYLTIKSKQRAVKRINSKISRLNRYYNAPSELFARAFEHYCFKKDVFRDKAADLYKLFDEKIQTDTIPLLKNFSDLI